MEKIPNQILKVYIFKAHIPTETAFGLGTQRLEKIGKQHELVGRGLAL